MAQRLETRFDEALARLLGLRTYAIKSEVWPRQGRPPLFQRRTVEVALSNLSDITEQALLRSDHRISPLFKDFDSKHQWRNGPGKGRGYRAKRTSFKAWYAERVKVKNCVYVFWSRQNVCLYVGRTLNARGTRPTDHFRKEWFKQVKRIDVYKFERRRDVPRFECLLTHKLDPRHSGMTPSNKKYYSRCPICEQQKLVRRHVKRLFRFR